MIKQLLFFKFKSDVSNESIQVCFEGYQSLVGKTPLQQVEIGLNISTEGFDKGYTHAAVASFADKEDVAIFLKHPDHLAFADKSLNPILADFMLLEIEC